MSVLYGDLGSCDFQRVLNSGRSFVRYRMTGEGCKGALLSRLLVLTAGKELSVHSLYRSVA